jgi:hypothetical protein
MREKFGRKRDEVTRRWKRLHNEGLYDQNCSPNIIGVNKPRKMRRAEHVARMEGGEVHTGFWWGDLAEGDH